MVWITLPNEFDEGENQWIRHKDIPPMQNILNNKTTYLDQKSSLNIESAAHISVRGTTIACNIGYVLNKDVDSLLTMMQAGMNIARLNLTLNHEDLEYHAQIVKNIRQAAKNYSKILGVPYPISIACNTVGTEIRTGYLEGYLLHGEEAEVELIAGNQIKLTTDPAYKDKCSAQVIYIDYEDMISRVVVGRIIYIDDGEIMLVILSISGAFLTCKILIGGLLGNQRGLNLPGTKVDLPPLSERDKVYIDFAVAHNIDFLFCALIKKKEDILEIRKALGKKGRHVKLVSKIEDSQGYDNLDEIISVSDAIVIARGDLFLEFTIPKLIIAQKYITAKCIKQGCPVIISRELIESMIFSPKPTRAEVCDIANAVLDGVDVVMLARETAKGQNVPHILKFVSQACKEAEAINWRTSLSMFNDWALDTTNLTDTLAMTAVDSSIKCRAAAIFVVTDTGNMAKSVSKNRPRCPIVAITRNARVSRELNIYKSVIPFLFTKKKLPDPHEDIEAQVVAATKFGSNVLFIRSNDPLIILVDYKCNHPFNHTMRVQYVSELEEMVEEDEDM